MFYSPKIYNPKNDPPYKYYKKVVDFITSVPTKDTAKHRSISFSNTIECIYDENGKLKSITTYRQKIDTNTLKIKGKRNVIFNKRKEHLEVIDKFKFKEDKGEFTSKHIFEFLNRTFIEFYKDNWELILKKFKFPTINFKVLKRLVEEEIKSVLCI